MKDKARHKKKIILWRLI